MNETETHLTQSNEVLTGRADLNRLKPFFPSWENRPFRLSRFPSGLRCAAMSDARFMGSPDAHTVRLRESYVSVAAPRQSAAFFSPLFGRQLSLDWRSFIGSSL